MKTLWSPYLFLASANYININTVRKTSWIEEIFRSLIIPCGMDRESVELGFTSQIARDPEPWPSWYFVKTNNN